MRLHFRTGTNAKSPIHCQPPGLHPVLAAGHTLMSVPRIIARPFQLEAVAHSSLPLLGASDTKELCAELQATAAPNRIRHLAGPSSVSENLNRTLAAQPWPRTEDCSALLLARVVVSEDLHKPLARSARADGKRYTPDAQAPSPEKLQTPPLAFVGAEQGNRKAFEQARGRVKRGMSVWDLLLPLLQRPVNLDLGTVVDLPSNLYAFQTKGVKFLVETPELLTYSQQEWSDLPR